jgi:hypothetical protein
VPCEIKTTSRFRKCIAGKEADMLETLRRVQAAFGQPRIHSGLSIRKIAPDIFVCRTDLKLRLVFLAEKGVLTFDFAGIHDEAHEVQNYLRGKR